jgi:poly(ADP-ribose) glycohydrolase
MKDITISFDKDDIENYFGFIKVDFANRYIGGGALSFGLVQEEIMFCNHPEMYTSQLLC